MKPITTKEIAEKLHVSVRTVQKHLKKMGIKPDGRDYHIDNATFLQLRYRIATSCRGRKPKNVKGI